MDWDGRIELPTERLLAHIDGPVGWLVFNNPARRNAVSLEMWEAMPLALERFESDPAVRVIALRGAGEQAFVAGADISQFERQRSSAESVAHYNAISGRATAALAQAGKPTIAVIHGWCIGGGVGIAAACDLRIAADTAKFGVPAARLGLGYAMSGVKQLMSLVGPAYAKEIFYTARHFSAAEAQAMGLVNRVVPAAELEATAQGVCDMIAANAPLTLQAVKRTVDELCRDPSAPDRALSDRLVAACFASEDYVEGRRAFMEKRKPVFTGR